jgi:hypothetical protein
LNPVGDPLNYSGNILKSLGNLSKSLGWSIESLGEYIEIPWGSLKKFREIHRATTAFLSKSIEITMRIHVIPEDPLLG